MSTHPRGRGLIIRMLRAARLDKDLYNELKADPTATPQAISVVVIVAIAFGISFAVPDATRGGPARNIPIMFAFGVLGTLLLWVTESAVVYWIGARLLRGTAAYGDVVRSFGFAQSPGVLYLFTFIPVLGGLIAAVTLLWTFTCEFVAIREGLNLNTGRTIATLLAVIIAFAIVYFILITIFAFIGFFGLGILSRALGG